MPLHGAGKNLAKGEAARVLRHLVTEGILTEDVKKSDTYGSVSSVLKVAEGIHDPWLVYYFIFEMIFWQPSCSCLGFIHMFSFCFFVEQANQVKVGGLRSGKQIVLKLVFCL